MFINEIGAIRFKIHLKKNVHMRTEGGRGTPIKEYSEDDKVAFAKTGVGVKDIWCRKTLM